MDFNVLGRVHDWLRSHAGMKSPRRLPAGAGQDAHGTPDAEFRVNDDVPRFISVSSRFVRSRLRYLRSGIKASIGAPPRSVVIVR